MQVLYRLSYVGPLTLSESVQARHDQAAGAGNGVRTRDPQLGRLMLCQLSYSRSESVPNRRTCR